MSGLLRFGVKLGNDRFEALLARLGSPHLKFDAVHVGGTKGKGSTATFAASILRSAGYNVGIYLSPFVYNLRERIQINGEMISEEDFARIVTDIKPHIDELSESEHGQVTEFELKTAVGFVYFAEKKVDYAVIEVGLGGRLDATNVLPCPKVAVITNIGYDHVEILGHTLPEIAREKAGIIKQGGKVVTAVNDRSALNVIVETAEKQNASLSILAARRDWTSLDDGSFSIHSGDLNIPSIRLSLRGEFQHSNATLAAKAVSLINDHRVTPNIIKVGLENAALPGRFEIIHSQNPTIVVDVAHNELSALALRDALIDELDADKRPVVLVVGMSRGHDPMDFIRPLLSPRGSQSICVHSLVASEPTFRPRRVEDIINAAKSKKMKNSEIMRDIPSAAACALHIAKKLTNPVVVATGSFYTVGDLPYEVWRSLLNQSDDTRLAAPLNAK
jgi:dihydrofolate synthase/folylpolyglutamate synthase